MIKVELTTARLAARNIAKNSLRVMLSFIYVPCCPVMPESVFTTTTIKDEAGTTDYPFFWTGTTHQTMDPSYAITGRSAIYIAFGKALGYFSIASLTGQ